MDKQAIHPSGATISFTDETHSYVDSTGKKYISCTELIDRFFPEFDTETIAAKYAKKRGLDKDDVIKEWELNRDTAAAFGTRVHEHAEKLLLKQASETTNPHDQIYFDVVRKFVRDELLPNYNLVECEKIIFSPKYGVAGMVDLIMKDRKGRIMIFDWKSNKEIKQTNKYQSGLGFLSHLPDCNYYHYCLQLNIYRKLLEEEGYYRKLDNCVMKLFHVGIMNVRIYEIPIMERETNKLLESVIL